MRKQSIPTLLQTHAPTPPMYLGPRSLGPINIICRKQPCKHRIHLLSIV